MFDLFDCSLISISQHVDVENFKKLNFISKDEFDTLAPKIPVEPNQEAPPPPMPGGLVKLLWSEFPASILCIAFCLLL